MDLKSAFQDELNYLRQLAAERAHENPALAEFLNASENDDDVEFLFEHFAFLMAKLRLKVDDAFPEITQNLLSRVWPTPLRPIPSTAMVQFQPDAAASHQLAKGSQLSATTRQGEMCHYQLARDMAVLPYQIAHCELTNTPTNSTLKLKIQWLGAVTKTGQWQAVPLTLFLSPDPQVAGLLQLWFEQYLKRVSAWIEEKPFSLSRNVVKNFVPSEANLVLPLDIPLFWRLQLLQEYLHLPHINQFITLDLTNEFPAFKLDADGCFEMIFEFSRPLLTDDPIDVQTAFIANCVPVVNLYDQQLNKYAFVTGQSTYQYQDETGHHDPVYQIRSIYSKSGAGDNDESDERSEDQHYLPVTQFATNQFDSEQLYYQSVLEHDVQGQVQLQLTFIDSQGERVVEFPHEFFFCDVQQTNGHRCDTLTLGDINIPSLNIAKSLQFGNITLPTPALPPLVDSHQHWPIISYLSFSPLFLKDLAAVKQLLIDLNYHQPLTEENPQNPFNDQVNAIVSLATQAEDWIVRGVVKRGLGIILTLDPTAFTNEGEMYQFASMLANVLPFCLTKSNFLMLTIINRQTGLMWSLLPVWGSRDQI